MTNASPTVLLAVFALLLVFGKILAFLQERYRVPEAFILVALGFVLQASGWLDTASLGVGAKVFTSLAVLFILFESALDIRIDELRRTAGETILLTILGFIGAVVAVSTVAYLVVGLGPTSALLTGCILGGTSTAVVVPVARAFALRRETQGVLALESALNDPLCVLGTFALLAAAAGTGAVDLPTFGQDAVLGILFGAIGGLLCAAGIRWLGGERGTLAFLTASVIATWALAEASVDQGALACIGMGLVLGNVRGLPGAKPDAPPGLGDGPRMFATDLAFALKVLFLVYLGASVRASEWRALLAGTLAIGVLLFIRAGVVRVALRASGRDRAIAAVLTPKGLAAAALASLPVQHGLSDGRTIEAFAAGAILASIAAGTLLPTLVDKTSLGRALQERLGDAAATASPARSPPAP